MDCVELTSRSRTVQKRKGMERIRKMGEIGRLKTAVDIAEELGRKEAKRKCAMRLVERLMLDRKYGKAKKTAGLMLEDRDFLKAVSAVNENLIGQGKFLRSAELNGRYSFICGMSASAGLEISRRIRSIEYRGLKRLARKYRAESELARHIAKEIGRFRSLGLNSDANWLSRKFGIVA
ncbi:MAG: hypothetical protein NTY68_01935 [Candidatus Micrarchaeota archaeon]|nr:hypothetical protein [Candidatus Micrarchaeota archaeon]